MIRIKIRFVKNFHEETFEMWMNNVAMKDWIQNEHRWSIQVTTLYPLVLNRGQGVWLWDIEGRRYLDMTSSYSAVNYGHFHPKILGALLHQAGRLSLCSGKFYHDQSMTTC